MKWEDNKLRKSKIKKLQGLSILRLHKPRQPCVARKFPLYIEFLTNQTLARMLQFRAKTRHRCTPQSDYGMDHTTVLGA